MRKKLLTLSITLAKEIAFMLESQHYLPGDKLPSERVLAEAFDVQRATIREALNELIQESVIESQERRGYFMAKPRIVKPINLFYNEPVIDDPHIKYKLMKFELIEASERLARKMLIPPETPLFRIVKLCYEDGSPIAYETAYIQQEVFPTLDKKDVERQSLQKIARAVAQSGIAGSNQKITLVYANDQESKALNIEAGTPVMKQKCMISDNDGRLLIFFENILIYNRFSFFRKEAR